MVGLKYQDLLLETPDVEVAVSRLSPEQQLARLFDLNLSFRFSFIFVRQRRITRAFDLSLKHEELPEEFQEKEPFDVCLSYSLFSYFHGCL